jgi:hypothetical protein
MPIGAHDHLDQLYEKQRLLLEEAARLEAAHDLLGSDAADENRRYILKLQVTALREESTRIAARISDILELDLQR